MSDDADFRGLLEDIRSTFHHDFTRYATASLKRRVGLVLTNLRLESIRELRRRLREAPEIFEIVLGHLTVQVSDMFRDPPFFQTFRAQVVPELRTHPSFRVWVAGCSSGEEAYSLAIVLDEEGLLERALIYCTDINPAALSQAQAGIYAIDRFGGFSERYRASGGKRSLSEYYTAAYGGAALDRRLRANMVFSDHSLATDSVFAEVQVVSCRNVLIYFDRQLQDRALGLFASALSRRGFLGLGSKESTDFSRYTSAFEHVENRWYKRC